MNRLLVLLVASMLGTGCVVSDHCNRVVSIGWPSFLLADGSVTASCTTAGISDVDVFIDDRPVATINCGDHGVNVTDVSDSSHLFTVEGIDSVSGGIALRDEFSIGSGCGDQAVDTQPSEGTFILSYSFSPNFCTSATQSFIWFTLHDDISGDTIAYDSAHAPQTYTCGNGSTTTPVPITFALASGPYTLQRTEEVLYPGPTQQAGNCNATQFTMTGGLPATQLNVPLADAVSCF